MGLDTFRQKYGAKNTTQANGGTSLDSFRSKYHSETYRKSIEIQKKKKNQWAMEDLLAPPKNTEPPVSKPIDQIEYEKKKSWDEQNLFEKTKSTLTEIPSTIKTHFKKTGEALQTNLGGFEAKKSWEDMSVMEKTKAGFQEAQGVVVQEPVRQILNAGVKVGSSIAGIGGFLNIPGFEKANEGLQRYQQEFQQGLAPKTYKEDDNIFDDPKLLLNPEFISRNVMEQIPNLAVMLKTKGWGEGLLELGGAYSDRMSKNNESGEEMPVVDRLYAGSIGVINGVLGKLGFDMLFDKNPALRKAISAKVGESVTNAITAVLGTGAEIKTEYIQEAIPQIATKVIYDEGGTWQEVLAQAHKQGKVAASSAFVTSAPISALGYAQGSDVDPQTAPAVIEEEKPQWTDESGVKKNVTTDVPENTKIERPTENTITLLESLSMNDLEKAEEIKDKLSTDELKQTLTVLEESEKIADGEQKSAIARDKDFVEKILAERDEAISTGIGKTIIDDEKSEFDKMDESKRAEAVATIEKIAEADHELSGKAKEVVETIKENNKKIDDTISEIKEKKVELLAEKKKSEDKEEKKKIQEKIDELDTERFAVSKEKNKITIDEKIKAETDDTPKGLVKVFKKNIEKIKGKPITDYGYYQGKNGYILTVHVKGDDERHEIESYGSNREDIENRITSALKEKYTDDERNTLERYRKYFLRAFEIEDSIDKGDFFVQEMHENAVNKLRKEENLTDEQAEFILNKMDYMGPGIPEKENSFLIHSQHFLDDIAKIKENTDSSKENETIQPDILSKEDLDNLRLDVGDALIEAGELGIKIKELRQYGSTERGEQKDSSDYDIYLEYEGDIREDDFFNLLADHFKDIKVNGRNVDFNPVKAEKTGTIKEAERKDPKNVADSGALTPITEIGGEKLKIPTERGVFGKNDYVRIGNSKGGKYTTNGFILDFNVKNIPENATKSDESMDNKVDELVSGVNEADNIGKPLGFYNGNLTVKCFALKYNEEFLFINNIYYNYFVKKYKNASLHSTGIYDPVFVKNNGELVGILMPLKTDIQEDKITFFDNLPKSEKTAIIDNNKQSYGKDKESTEDRPETISNPSEIQGGDDLGRSDKTDGEIPGYDEGTVPTEFGDGLVGSGTTSERLTKKQRQIINEQVEALLKEKDFSVLPDDYTLEERNLLASYTGAGGKESVGADGAGLLNEYYTPNIVIDKMWEIAKSLNPEIQTAFEPSAGIGRIINRAPVGIQIDGAEISKISGTIAKILNPSSDVRVGDFQEIFFNKATNKQKDFIKYDLVIGNPPFGKRAGFLKGKGEEPKIGRMEEYWIKRGLDMTDDGGYLIYVVNSSFLQTKASVGKEKISKIGRLVDAYRLPEKSFEDTSIGTDIVIFRKIPDKEYGERSLLAITEDRYFKSNKDKVLGETKTRKNRFGKEETFVEGKLEDAINKIVISSDESQETLDTNDEFVKSKIDKFKTEPKQTEKPVKKQRAKITKRKTEDKFVVLPKKNAEKLVNKVQGISNANNKPEIISMLKKIDRDMSIPEPTETEKKFLNYDNGKYVPNAIYFSGNIYNKIERLERNKAEAITEIGEDKYNKQLEGLKNVLPKPLTIEEIVVDPMDRFVGAMNTTIDTGDTDTVLRAFTRYIRRNKVSLSPRVRVDHIIRYVEGRQAEKETKAIMGLIKQDAKRLFNSFLRNDLSEETQKAIVEKYNREKNSFVRTDYSNIPVEIKDMAKQFRGKDFQMSQTQKEGVAFLVNKGSGAIAYGVGVGKTHTLAIATKANMDKGWTKRPLFVVPKATIEETWIKTLHEMFPTVPINNLGGLQAPVVRKLKKERGEVKNWIKDGEITVISHQGILRLGFTPEELLGIHSELQDAIWQEDTVKTKRKGEEQSGKVDEIIGSAQKYVTDVMLSDLGIDHISVDEVHNFRKIFQGAKIEKDEKGNEMQKKRFSNVIGGTPSKQAQQLFLMSQHIQKNNNNRNVFLASATPFENHATEVYNILSLVARDRMKEMGIFNINDFFAAYAKFETEIDRKLTGEWVNREKMKDWENKESLFSLINEFMDFQEDETLVRPEKKIFTPHLQMSAKQEENLQKIQDLLLGIDTAEDGAIGIKGKPEDGAFLKASTYSISNSVSPYFIDEYTDTTPTAKQIVEESPKIEFTLEMCRKIKEEEKTKGLGTFIYFGKQGVKYHPALAEYFAKELGYKSEEVAYLSGNISDEQKEAIKKDFNSGKIKVLLGGDQTKEGIDLQLNGFATINLALGWNPTEITQTGGRVWRQGNPRNFVLEIYPLVENSGDAMMYNKFDEKAGRINQIKNSLSDKLEITEVDAGEKKLSLLTNPEDKTKLQIELNKVELYSEQVLIENDINELNKLTADRVNAQNQIEYYTKNLSEDYFSKERKAEFKKEIKSYKNKLERIEEKIKSKEFNDINEEILRLQDEKDAIEKKITDINETYPELLAKFTSEYNEMVKKRKSLQEHIGTIASTFNDLRTYTDEELADMKFKKIKEVEAKRNKIATMKSISDGKISSILSQGVIQEQIDILKENMNPFIAQRLVTNIAVELFDEEDGKKMFSAGTFNKFTDVASFAQDQRFETMEEAVVHEPGHLAFMYLTKEEKEQIKNEYGAISVDERRMLFGKNAKGQWRYDLYVKSYGADDMSLIEEIAVTLAARDYLANKPKESRYSKNKVIRKIQEFIEAFTEFSRRIYNLAFGSKAPRALSAREIMQQVYDKRSTFFDGRDYPSKKEIEEMVSQRNYMYEISGKPEMEIRSVPFDKINVDPELVIAMKDVKKGRKSFSYLPILLKADGNGRYNIIDGRHRLIEQFIAGKRDYLATMDERIYRIYAEEEETLLNKNLIQIPAHIRAGRPVKAHTRMLSVLEEREATDKPLIKDGQISILNLYKKVYSNLYEGKVPPMTKMADRPLTTGMTKRAFTLGKRYATKLTKDNYKSIQKEIRSYIISNIPPKHRGELIRAVINAKNKADVEIVINKVDLMVDQGKGKGTPAEKLAKRNEVYRYALEMGLKTSKGELDGAALKRMILSITKDNQRGKMRNMTMEELDKLKELLGTLVPDEFGRSQLASDKMKDDLSFYIPEEFMGKEFITKGELMRSLSLKDVNGWDWFNRSRSSRMVLSTNKLTSDVYHEAKALDVKTTNDRQAFSDKLAELYKKANKGSARPNKDLNAKLIDFLERRIGEDKLTESELELASHVIKFYAESIPVMKPNRIMKGYFTHTRQSFVESVRENGLTNAFREVFTKDFLAETRKNLPPEIYANLENLTPNDMFNPYALKRTGDKFSSDFMFAVNSYASVYFNKINFDSYYSRMNSIRVLLPRNLQVFFKRWIQTSRGRADVGNVPEYIKTTVDYAVAFEYFKGLAFNFAAAQGNIMIGFIDNFAAMNIFNLANGHKRYMTPKGFEIIKKYHITNTSVTHEGIEMMRSMPKLANKIAFFNMAIGEHYLRGVNFLGNLTAEEFKTGNISNTRLGQLTDLLGTSQPLMGKFDTPINNRTTYGKIMGMYLNWVSTRIENWINWSTGAVKTLKNAKGFDQKIIQNSDLHKTVRLLAIFYLFSLMLNGRDRWEKEEESAKGLLSPKRLIEMMSASSRPLFKDIINLWSGIIFLFNGEQYQKSGGTGLSTYEDGDYKWVNYLKKVLEPQFIRQIENKKNPLTSPWEKEKETDPAASYEKEYKKMVKEAEREALKGTGFNSYSEILKEAGIE